MDVDGVPIHVGDVMELSRFDVEHPVVRTVDGIGKDVFFAWCGERGFVQHNAKGYRHHQTDSWEQIIADAEKLGGRWYDTSKWTGVEGVNVHMKKFEGLSERCRALAGEDA